MHKLNLKPLALLMAGLSCNAFASGFQLLEQNASGLGNAYAGSAVVAENASTIFFNPAGMTQLKPREVSVGLNTVITSFDFTNSGSLGTGALAGAGNGGDAGGVALIPNGYLSYALNKDLYLGFGVSAPFGLKTEYDNPWLGGAQALLFDIKTINLNPSVAYRVNDSISLGAGLDYMYMDAEYQRLAAVLDANYASTLVKLTADDTALGWNIGGLFKVSDNTSIGLSYRSKVKQKLEGTLAVSGTLAGLAPALTTGSAKADIELPDTFIFSVKQDLNKDWQMLADISWTGWSSVDQVNIVRTSGALSGATVQTLDAHFRDTWRFALGATQRYNDSWKIKYGVAFDQSPVRDAAHRLVSLPDNNRVWLSLGAQWKPDNSSALDFGLSYLVIGDSDISNNQAASGRGWVIGNYESSVIILGAQYSLAF